MRKPFQGVGNILRFNWHYYMLTLIVISVMICFLIFSVGVFQTVVSLLIALILLSVVISLTVSYLVYDRSGLYKMSYLSEVTLPDNPVIVNIHAGFDESSETIKSKIPSCKLIVFDFYDPSKHTETSIKRARKVYRSYPGTQIIDTQKINLENKSVDLVVLFLSAHEIRDDNERIHFFCELKRILKQDGLVIVTEHIRDTANFLAYNIGAFHFHSIKVWNKTFYVSGFKILEHFKTTPFITNFVIVKNGTTS